MAASFPALTTSGSSPTHVQYPRLPASVMYHRPSKLFVPLAKLKCSRRMDIGDGAYRVDLPPRLSRDGRLVSIDASHEGLGRQMYLMDIGHILDSPPGRRTSH